MSFASEPERDDGSLPPVNVVIPDDARELDRDVLAYRREVRALRRRQRRSRLLRPFGRAGVGGPAAIVPLIALCLALALVGGALLSVLTISPAGNDNAALSTPPASPRATSTPIAYTTLPTGYVTLVGQAQQVHSLVSSAIVLVPSNCGCGPSLRRIVSQADAGGARAVYFIGTGASDTEVMNETRLYSGGHADYGEDVDGVLAKTYHPVGLTALLVFDNAIAVVRKNLSGPFDLNLSPGELNTPGPKSATAPTARANPTANHPATSTTPATAAG